MASAQRWDEADEGRRREARELRAEVEARDEAICRLEGRVRAPLNSDPHSFPLFSLLASVLPDHGALVISVSLLMECILCGLWCS
jgi:hypothetical protein